MTLPFFNKRPLLAFITHWVAWVFLYSLIYLPTILNSPKINWGYLYRNYLVTGSINYLLFYLIAFLLLPKIGIQKRRWVWVVTSCILLVVLTNYLNFRISNYWLQQALKSNNAVPDFFKKRWNNQITQPAGIFSYQFRIYLQTNIYYTFSVVFIAFAYRLLITWYLQEKNRIILQNEKLKADLAFLQMQINPHFLFNALNNIYSLSVLENSRSTGASLLKLSELLRYMLYEKTGDDNKIGLEKEIMHINNYIDLEKMRHQGPIYFNFSIEGDPKDKRIPPLLIFPLIENAFKHGLLTDARKPVNIQLIVTGNQLILLLDNYINHNYKDKTGGIGVQNVQKRLALIYGNDHTFDVQKTAEQYKVNLHVPL